jgi:hypothetical protein
VAASGDGVSLVGGYGQDLLGLCRSRVPCVVAGEALPDAADLGLAAALGEPVSFNPSGLS